MFSLHQRGGAAAEEDGVQHAAWVSAPNAVDLEPRTLAASVDWSTLGGDMAVEVAVGALRLAEGPVQIQAEPGVAPVLHHGNRAATSLAKGVGPVGQAVLFPAIHLAESLGVWPSGMKIGSKPWPWSPRPGQTRRPVGFPSKTRSCPSGLRPGPEYSRTEHGEVRAP